MYKLVLFDLGGVLFTNGTNKFAASISKRYNLPLEQIKEVLDGDLGTQYRESKITRDEFWKKLKALVPLKEPAEDLESEWIASYELIKETRDIVLKLRDNHKVYYLSDNVKERVEKLNEIHGFLKWFDGGVFSYEVGVRKPNPKIYEYALKKAGYKASETVFIDDKASALKPAEKIGIKTILFETPDRLEKDLKEIGFWK